MLERSSKEYDRVLKDIGIATKCINIPRAWAETDRDGDEYVNACLRVRRLTSYARKREPIPQVAVVQLVNRLLSTVRFSDTGPRRDFFIRGAFKAGRGFFIVSRTEISLQHIIIMDKGTKVIRFMGGECQQAVDHFHYMFVTNFDVALRDIRIARKGVDLTLIGTNTVAVARYIFNQLKPGAPFHNSIDKKYTTVQLDWYNPEPKYKELKSSVRLEISQTNYRFTCADGIMENHVLGRMEFIDNKRRNLVMQYRMQNACRARYNVLTGKIDTAAGYFGQPVVIVASCGADYNTVKERAGNMFKRSQFVIVE